MFLIVSKTITLKGKPYLKLFTSKKNHKDISSWHEFCTKSMTLLYHLGFVSIASVTDKAKGKETNKVPTNLSFSIKVKHHKIKSVSGDAMTVK